MSDGILSDDDQQAAAASKLTSYVERLERMLDEIDQLKDGLKDLKAEIKSDGFNIKAIDRVVAIRRSKGAADKEAELINDVLLYAHATGTPLDVEMGDNYDRGRDVAPLA